MISVSGDDQVVMLSVLSDVLFRVIDNVVRTDRARDVQVPRTAYGCHLSAKGFRDLNRECSHTAAGAVDKNLLSWLDLSVFANALKRSQPGDRDGGRGLERHVGGFQRQEFLWCAHILGKRASADAEDLIPRSKLFCGCADC